MTDTRPTLRRAGTMSSELQNPFAPSPTNKTFRGSSRQQAADAPSTQQSADEPSPTGANASSGGGRSSKLVRQRSASHYARMDFGLDADPEAEFRAKLERAKKEKEEREAAARAKQQREEQERNEAVKKKKHKKKDGLLGWIGSAMGVAPSPDLGPASSPTSPQLNAGAIPSPSHTNNAASPYSGIAPQQHQEESKEQTLMVEQDNDGIPSDSSFSDDEDDDDEEDDYPLVGEEYDEDDDEDAEAERPLTEMLLRKEVLTLPPVESTMRMMARGDYFTLYTYTEGQKGGSASLPASKTKNAPSISVHKHRRISTMDIQMMEKKEAREIIQGMQGNDDMADGDDGDDVTSGSSTDPFFTPQPHPNPVQKKDVFVWVEFPSAVDEPYKADTICHTNRDARGKLIRNQRLSNVNGGSDERYRITSNNYLYFLKDATIHWCEAMKLPTKMKNEKGKEVDYPTHMPHPKRNRAAYKQYLSHPHQWRVKKDDQRIPVTNIVDLYTGKKSYALLSTSLHDLPDASCFTIASKDISLSFSTNFSRNYQLHPHQTRMTKRRRARLDLLDPGSRRSAEEHFNRKVSRLLDGKANRQRDSWLLGFASLLSVGRNLVKHRIERVALGDKQLAIARKRCRRKIHNFLNHPRSQGPFLVRDAAALLKTGVYAKRYWVESHMTNDVTDQQQTTFNQLAHHRSASTGSLALDDNEDVSSHLDSVRRILHYEEVFVWADFPNDPLVKDLSEWPLDDRPITTSNLRAPKGGMAGDAEEELDMYGAALYWCEPNEATQRPRNPSQSLFFSQLEDIYIGQKTEVWVLEHVAPTVCLSLYTPTIVLDLQFEREDVRNGWIKSIVALLQLHRIIGARSEKDANNSTVVVPPHLLRKHSQPGLTPLWLHHRSVSRDSLYGSIPIFRDHQHTLSLSSSPDSGGSGSSVHQGGSGSGSGLLSPPFSPFLLSSPNPTAGRARAESDAWAPPPAMRKTSDAAFTQIHNTAMTGHGTFAFRARAASDLDLGKPALPLGHSTSASNMQAGAVIAEEDESEV